MPGDRSSEQGGLSEERVWELVNSPLYRADGTLDLGAAIATREALSEAWSQLAEWNDPDSARRQGLTEEIIFALGDGARSEIEMREGQLDVAEVALHEARAQVEAMRADAVAALRNVESLRAQLAAQSEKLTDRSRLIDQLMTQLAARDAAIAECRALLDRAQWERVADLDAYRSLLARLDAAKEGPDEDA